MSLKRSLGTPALLFTAIAGIIGSGWLFGPYFAAQIAGPAAILSWVIGGCLMMFIAVTFAELASAFPVAGGMARFLQFSHGAMVSFTLAWIGWLSSVAVAPIETMALLQYLSTYFPSLTHAVGDTHVLTGFGMMIASLVMILMCFINYFGTQFLSRANSLMVFFKLAVPTITIVFFAIHGKYRDNFTSMGFAPYGFKGILQALPTAGVIFSFIGYNPAVQLAGEAKNPQRSIPFAILGALFIAIIIYITLQIVFIDTINPSDFAHGWSNLSYAGSSGPFAGLARNMGAVWLVVIIIIGATIAPFGTALIFTASSARSGYAMVDNGYFPPALKVLNKYGVPMRMIVLNYFIGLALFLPFPTWQRMVGFLVGALVLAFAVGPLALIVLRKTMPLHPRPFKIPLPKLICLIAFYVCNLIIYWTGWLIVSKIIVAILLGYIFLFCYRFTEHGRKIDLHWRNAWWLPIYISALGITSYLGAFGGLNVISFGWDFLVIAIITYVIFEAAARSGIQLHSVPLSEN